MVHERGRDIFNGCPPVSGTFARKVATVCDLSDHQYERVHSPTAPTHYDTAAQLEQLVAIGRSSPVGQENVGRNWDGPEGEFWWTADTP